MTDSVPCDPAASAPVEMPETSELHQACESYSRSRDARRLAQVYRASLEELFAVALRITRDPMLAEDAVQDAFLDLLHDPSRYDTDRPLLPWLVGVVRNKALKARRVAGRRPDVSRLLASRPLTEEPFAGEPEAAPIDRLSEPYLSLARLRWRYGMRPEQIAELVGKPDGTVRSLLSRSVARLRLIARAIVALVGVGALVRLVKGLAPSAPAAGTGVVRTTACLAGAATFGLGAAWLAVGRETPPQAPMEQHVSLGDGSRDWGWLHRRQHPFSESGNHDVSNGLRDRASR